MNFFIFDGDLDQNAQYYCKQHLVKIILEIAQLLCTAVSVVHYDGCLVPTEALDSCFGVSKTYKPTHKNHPCSIFARQSQETFDYTCRLGLALCRAYSQESNGKKRHASESLIRALRKHGIAPCQEEEYKETTILANFTTDTGKRVKMPLAMPHESVVRNQEGSIDVVLSHRNNFCLFKTKLARWSRGVPHWYDGPVLPPTAADLKRAKKLKRLQEKKQAM